MRLDHERPRWHGDADRVEQATHPERDKEPNSQTDSGRNHADDERLAENRAHDLPTARSYGPQQGELAGALSDEHREGVEDDEQPDEQGHAREDQQEHVEEPESLADGVGLLLVDCFCGDRLETLGQYCGDAGCQFLLRDTFGSLDVDLVDESWLACDLRGCGRVEHAQYRTGQIAAAAHRDDADDRGLDRGPLCLHRHAITDPKVVSLRSGLVNSDLAGTGRAGALDKGQAAEVRWSPRHGKRRRTW